MAGREDTDLAAFAREGPEVKTRGRLSANPAELIHLQQKDATCGYARDLEDALRMCSDDRALIHVQCLPITERFLDPGLMRALETQERGTAERALASRDTM